MTDADDGARRQWRRRRVLKSVAAGAGVAGSVGVATAQTETDGDGTRAALTKAVIPEQQQYDQTVTGFFIHIGPAVDPLEASVSDRCDFVDWANDETLAYDAQLIDRQADPEEQSITLYLHESTEVEAGMLFIINDREQCESGYLGIELERMGMNLAQLRARDFTPNDGGNGGGSGAGGPGMGVLSGIAGLLGAGWLLDRRRE